MFIFRTTQLYRFEGILTVHRRYYVEIKCQLDTTDYIYCRFYCMLNMFRAILCPSSGAREYYTDGRCLWYLVLWFSGCRYGVELKVMCPNTTGSDHLYNIIELLMMGIVLPETCWACNKICNKYNLLYLVGILFPHNNDDARSKSLQIKFNILWRLYNPWSVNFNPQNGHNSHGLARGSHLCTRLDDLCLCMCISYGRD